MSDDEWEKLAEQQEAIVAAIAEIKNRLDADDWRRKCLWLLASINRTAQGLNNRTPGREQSFKGLLAPLDCYANLVFKSAQDLNTVFTCFALIAEILEQAEKAQTLSFMDLWQRIRPLIEELETLETGDPPSLSASKKLIRDLQPELQDAERAAVRERFVQRSRASIDEMFARRKAEAEEYY